MNAQGGSSNNGSSSQQQQQQSSGSSSSSSDLSSYSFFAKYTYTTECALLAYNFHEIIRKDLRVFDYFDHAHGILNSDGTRKDSKTTGGDGSDRKSSKDGPGGKKTSKYDHRLVSVTLAFLFYKYLKL